MSKIAIIPARLGSKRLPNKNKRDLNGKPLIDWTIDEALNVKDIDEIRITTDDFDIINHCSIKYKGNKKVRIILRPEKLATDEAPMFGVVKHATSDLNLLDTIILLQPTCPLRISLDIITCLSLFEVGSGQPIYTVFREDFYRFKLNGAVYVFYKRKLDLSDKIVNEEPCLLYFMSKERSIDIDTLEDFEACERYLKNV